MLTSISSNNKHLEFWSKDDSFGLRMTNSSLKRLLRCCEKSYPYETGGILIGSYTKSLDCAVIEIITGPPKDSKHGKKWFKRGVQGLQKLLESCWESNRFYIGEWHFHPDEEPFPSGKDKNQLKQISKSKNYDCSTPILVIVGGRLPSDWIIRAYIFPYEIHYQELFIW
jgi:integrative and conjugative element protein (TIGR02256 family)